MQNNQKLNNMNIEEYMISVIFNASKKGIALNLSKSGLTLFQEAKQALIDAYISRKCTVANKVMLGIETIGTELLYYFIKEENGYTHILPSETVYNCSQDLPFGEEKTVAHLVLSNGEVIEAVYKYESF